MRLKCRSDPDVRAFWSRHVALLMRSDFSQREYCARNGISRTLMSKWWIWLREDRAREERIKIGRCRGRHRRSTIANELGRRTNDVMSLSPAAVLKERADRPVVRQGHSKNPTGHDFGRFFPVFAEVFARLGDRDPGLSDHPGNEIAQPGKWTRAGPDPAAVLVEAHVAHVMELVFDAPVGAIEGKQAFGSGLTGRQAGDEIGDLTADFVADDARALDPHGLGRARPSQMRHDLRSHGDLAHLDAAMTFVIAFGSA